MTPVSDLYKDAVGAIDRMMSLVEDMFGSEFQANPEYLREYAEITSTLENFQTMDLAQQYNASMRAREFLTKIGELVESKFLLLERAQATLH
jgi:hypothetical protein